MKLRISLKPCPVCGTEVKVRHGMGVTFFHCANKECMACVSFGGTKKTDFGTYEAENPVNNFNRRADNG